MHLSDLAIRSLRFVDGQKDYTDDLISGLTLRVGTSTKTFFLLIGSGKNRRRIKLGRFPTLTLQAARAKAKELIGDAQKRKDEPARIPFEEAFSVFMQGYQIKNKPVTVRETERLIRKHFSKLLPKHLQDLTRSEVVQLVDAIEGQATREHAYTALRTFFRWCRRYGTPDFLEGVEKPARASSRARLLTERELAQIWAASLSMGNYGRLVRCLFATGQRLSQIAYLEDSWIDRSGKQITFPAHVMKSNQDHTIPYGELTASLLGNETGLQFPTGNGKQLGDWNARKERLDKLCPIPHWVHHDARRFFSSTHAKLGTPPHITERLLAHTVGSTETVVSRIYNRYSFDEEKREAAEKYELYLTRLLAAAAPE